MVYLEVMREMDQSAERIHQRLNRAVRALNTAKVDYSVIGGNAVDLWLKTVEAGVLTRDVDILLRREDIGTASEALKTEGFIRRDLVDRPMFLDGPSTKARDAVHIVFAKELHKPYYLEPSPDVSEFEDIGGVRVISLTALVQMKLTAFRSKDRGHIIELLKVGIVNQSMIERLPESLRDRFREVLDEFETTVEDWERD